MCIMQTLTLALKCKVTQFSILLDTSTCVLCTTSMHTFINFGTKMWKSAWGTYLVSGHSLEGYSRSWVEPPQGTISASKEREIAYRYMCIMYSHESLFSFHTTDVDRGLINTRQVFERPQWLLSVKSTFSLLQFQGGVCYIHGLVLSTYICWKFVHTM